MAEINEKLKKDIQESNRQTVDGKKVRIKIRIKPKATLPDQNTVYLDLLHESGKRELKYLKRVIDGRPSRYTEDKITLEIVKTIRDKHEIERNKDPKNYTLADGLKQLDFNTFWQELAEIKPENWKYCLKHFTNYTGGKAMPFEQIDRKFCIDFAEYLKSIMAGNSAFEIYSKFKAVLGEAVKQDKIFKNPATGITIKRTEVRKEYLLISEIEKLLATPYPTAPTAAESCRAFEFSFRTGLRQIDIINLKWVDIRDGKLYIKQQKTQTVQQIDLAPGALRLIEDQRQRNGNNENVFNLPAETAFGRNINKWLKAAEITKHITFHSARHSYIVNALYRGIDIYTVSKLAGHKNLNTTQVYAKIVDEAKAAAVLKMDF
jgi:integrase